MKLACCCALPVTSAENNAWHCGRCPIDTGWVDGGLEEGRERGTDGQADGKKLEVTYIANQHYRNHLVNYSTFISLEY